MTYTGVVVYLRRTLEGPFLHLFFWGVLKLFVYIFLVVFCGQKFSPEIFTPPPELAGCWEALGGVGGRWEGEALFFPPA